MKLKKTWKKAIFFLKNYNYEWKFKLLVALPILVILIASDWIVKGAVTQTMQVGENAKILIPNFISLEYYINLGSAFGLNNSSEKLPLTITLATLFTLILIIIMIFLNSKKWIIPVSFMLGGSFANLIGRAWCPIPGGVVDMFRFEFSLFGSNSYVFNLADLWVNVSIGIGFVCFVWELVLIFTGNDKKQEDDTSETDR